MKKSILTLFFILTAILSYSIPIISVTKQCGGLFGYDYVEFHREVYEVEGNGEITFGWVGHCSGRGFNKCKPPRRNDILNNDLDPIEADYYDQKIAEDLIAQVTEKIGVDNTNGSTTSTMVVEGQSFKRIYTLTWSAEPSVCYDDNGNEVLSYSTIFNCSVKYVHL